MNKLKLAMLFSVVLCLLIVIPASFAVNNETALGTCDESVLDTYNETAVSTSVDDAVLERSNETQMEASLNESVLQKSDDDMMASADDEDSLGADYYFDSNAENDTGNGSKENPYKNLNPSRMADDSNIHLADGVYDLANASKTLKNVTIIGQSAKNTIVKNAKFTIAGPLSLYNLTLVNVVISGDAKLTASNVIFTNSTSSQGGAINSKGTINIDNCTFSNNRAEFGGAIYAQNANINIINSIFINNEASIFGGAVTTVSSSLNFNNVTVRGNKAKYYGGAIYALYGNFTLNDSVFDNNSAKEGGAIFIDTMKPCMISGNTFSNNNASYVGAAYLLDNNLTCFEDNTFINNSADFENDCLQTITPNSRIGDGNYLLINTDTSTFNGTIPSRYDLREQGYVTPVKNQGNGGNCWAFSTLAALESCILKASGITYDLSEENMKNLMSKYSDYGWKYEPNTGGTDDMGIAYLLAWMGPVNETDDVYEPSSFLSPLLNSFYHIQNLLFIYRNNFTDNDAVKEAIMKYGAVSTSIYWAAKYRTSKNSYCYGTETPNHAVAIVGWDDNYSKDNFAKAPEGDGAWIIKNSWGTGSGEGGYYYVSYYDTSCAIPGRWDISYTFILNDTVKFDKNYQYDIPGRTDIFVNSSSTVWYKNVFTSTDDEFLAAVSTYFSQDSNYTISIYVNNTLKHVQDGFSGIGYFTINLNEFVPLNKGDVFEVEFKITADGEAYFPVSEIVRFNKYFYKENVSFVSYDGENWSDLYNLTWKYSTHSYDSQVACIKAFTVFDIINTTTQLTIENRSGYTIVAKVLNQYGRPVTSGHVDFTVNGRTYTVRVTNGFAELEILADPGFYNITAIFTATGHASSQDNFSGNLNLTDTTLYLDIIRDINPVGIQAHVVNQNGFDVNCGNVTFEIEGKFFTVNVTDGYAVLKYTFRAPGNYNVSAVYNPVYYYMSSNNKSSIDVVFTNTTLTLNISNCYNPVNITAAVFDQYGHPVGEGNVTFMIEGRPYTVEVIGGVASIGHVFENIGTNEISATFECLGYNPSNSTISRYIYLDKVDLDVNITKTDLFDLRIDVGLSKKVNCTVFIIINETHSVDIVDGVGKLVLKGLSYGKYNVTAGVNSTVHYSENTSANFSIDYLRTYIRADDVEIYYGGTYSYKFYLYDEKGNPVSNRTLVLTYKNTQMKQKTNSRGEAAFDIDLDVGTYTLTVRFDTEGIYYKSDASINVKVKSTITLPAATKYTYNSNYVIKLTDKNGNPIKNKEVLITLDGTRSYTIKTDSNGKATFNIKLSAKSYNIKITNLVTGEVKTSSFKVVKRITQNKSIKMYYGAGTSYKVKVFDDNGNIAKGVKVTFKIAGKSYTRTTNSKGFASYKITQKPGKYTITASYKGFKVSNSVVVKSTIVTKNISVKKGKTIKFNAKLLNSKGKILKNKKITFKFKAKTYKVKTNGKGIATLKIANNYKAGKYTISTKYGKLTVKNTVRIKK